MGDIRIREKPNAVPNNAAVFAIEMEVGGVWYTRKVTWEQLTGLIAALNNLENYYKKTETYTKTEVNQLIAQIPSFTVEIVQELPTEDISTTTLYLVPKTTAGTLDYYDEFINLDGTTSGWEYVGKTEVDLSNYYTKSETEAYVKGDGADYIAGTKTFSSLTTTAKTILGAINEAAGAASGAQADATRALSDASAAQGTANSASSAASAAQGTADSALTAAGNAASAASAAQGTANNAMTTAQSMAVSVTNTLTPGDTTKKVADVTQNNTTVPIYGDDAEKVVVALTDTKTTAAGNPVTFTTEQAGGAKSALVTFAPKQDLHGYDHPWAGGNGKNKLPNIATTTTINNVTFTVNSDGSVKVYSTGASADTSCLLTNDNNPLIIKANTDYILSGCPSGGGGSKFELMLISAPSSGVRVERDYGYGVTINGDTTDISRGVQIVVRSGQAIDDVFYPMVRLSTESDPTFEPYSNICPISGWDGLNLNVSDGESEGTDYTATFPSTEYGGSYDFVSGKGVSNYSVVTYNGSENWLLTDNPHVFYLSLYSIFQNEIMPMCNKYKGLENGSSGSMNNNEIRRNRNATNLLVRDDRASTVEEFKALCANENIAVAYFRNTAVEITLTPADVNLLKGSNTVWTDGDTVQVKYSELPNGNLGAVIDYIQKLEARVKALES